MIKTRVVNLRYDEYDVYIGRGSKWGNPFRIGSDGTSEEAIEKYREYLENNEKLLNDLRELKGKILGCYCKPKACHGDILVEFIEDYGLQVLLKLIIKAKDMTVEEYEELLDKIDVE